MDDQHTALRAEEILPAGMITEAMLEDFQTVGAVLVKGLLSPAWVDYLRENMDEILSDSFRHTPDKVGNTDMLFNHEAFRRVVYDSPIVVASAKLMQSSSARYYEDVLVYVEEGAVEGKSTWHQDVPSWPVKGRQLTNAWFTLEKTTATSGAIRIVEGSHRGPHYYPNHIPKERQADADHDAYLWDGGPLPDVDADPERFPVRIIETDPGDVVIFHPAALHMGYGPPVGGPRRTFTLRFLGDDVRWQPRRSVYHPWMRDAPIEAGAVPEHPRLPLVWARA
jgi:ectoine hydroxylase-related dioxygenase (phytanoyl-CoA dioxygenase family)